MKRYRSRPHYSGQFVTLSGDGTGAGAGAAAGAAIGSFIPGIGTAIGSLVGGLFGGMFGHGRPYIEDVKAGLAMGEVISDHSWDQAGQPPGGGQWYQDWLAQYGGTAEQRAAGGLAPIVPGEYAPFPAIPLGQSFVPTPAPAAVYPTASYYGAPPASSYPSSSYPYATAPASSLSDMMPELLIGGVVGALAISLLRRK